MEREPPTDAITDGKLLEVFMNLKGRGLTTAKKQKIISSLVEQIEVFPDRLEIHYGLGQSKIKRELVYASSLLEKNNLEVRYSTSFTNGAPNKIRTCDPYHVKVIL